MVAYACNPSIRKENQEFKVILGYRELETSLGYMKLCLKSNKELKLKIREKEKWDIGRSQVSRCG